ncbi:MAG: hypothetical protein FWF75_02080 [Propionibacteriaceae bacterium]|nr:hypothetical protein [Propionibacteriaceae bacterium]
MNTKKAAAAILSILLALIVVLGGATSAHAATNSDPVGIDPYGLCSTTWTYTSTSRGTDQHSQVGPTQSNHNGTSSPATDTFTATASGTVSATISGNANVSANVIFGSISASFGISVQASITASLGNSTQVIVPAGKTGNAAYGVWRAYTTGTEQLTNNACVVTQSHSVTAYSPYKVGWNTWIS